MSIESLSSGIRIPANDLSKGGPTNSSTSSTSGTVGTSFVDSLKEAVQQVDTLQQDATYQVNSLIEGNGADVHEAMISVQKADLSFQLMMQVRNKVVAAYQEIDKLQF